MTRIEIENEFREVTGINEAKKIYKILAKKLHPDVGGSEDDFKLLNTIYNDFIEHKIYFSNDSKIDLELEKIISQILHFEMAEGRQLFVKDIKVKYCNITERMLNN